MADEELSDGTTGAKPKPGGAGRGAAKDALMKRGDLEQIRNYHKPSIGILTKVDDADLSAALRFLPVEMRTDAEGRIRQTLKISLVGASTQNQPNEGALARYFRTVDTQARELARLLLRDDNIEPENWATFGATPDIVDTELRCGVEPKLHPDELSWVLARLARLCAAASNAAARNEAQKRGGRPTGTLMRLVILELRPLWDLATNPAAFVEACLAAVGEGRGVEAVRKAIERYGQNK